MLHASACIVPLRTVHVSMYEANCTCTTQVVYIIRATPAISVTALDDGRSIVNSRILRVQESSLLKDIL